MNASANIVLFGVLTSLAGCVAAPKPLVPAPALPRSSTVAMEIVPPPPGANRMQLPDSQRFVFPNLIDPVLMPVYPRDLLSARLAPILVCVEADIGADGLVMATRARVDTECATGPVREEFVRAALEAVKQWTFDPALLCVAPESVEDPCLHPQMIERPTQVRLTYAFRFSQVDGKPQVARVSGDR